MRGEFDIDDGPYWMRIIMFMIVSLEIVCFAVVCNGLRESGVRSGKE